MTRFRYPTPEELNAIEISARRARAAEVARLARAAVSGIRSVLGRATGPVDIKGPRHA